MTNDDAWPALPRAAWQDTYATLHMWTQIIGKVRLKLAPYVNHWWQVPLYVTSRGLTTTAIPYGGDTFDATFDFHDHVLALQTSTGRAETIALRPRSVADFYHEVMTKLRSLGIDVRIWTLPSEYPNPIHFDKDEVHASYDAASAHRCWRILLEADTILKQFRSRFIGKVSPVHFFWGGFDLAVTRFNGRRNAKLSETADVITREGYSHEVSSAGWWPGGGTSLTAPAFYSYASPEPEGFKTSRIPAPAYYSAEINNWLLPYDEVRTAADPRAMVLEFLENTYDAAANLGRWDRENLELP